MDEALSMYVCMYSTSAVPPVRKYFFFLAGRDPGLGPGWTGSFSFTLQYSTAGSGGGDGVGNTDRKGNRAIWCLGCILYCAVL